MKDYHAVLEMIDGRRAGKAIMAIVATASLNAYQDANIEGF